jgi:hypothetical protein
MSCIADLDTHLWHRAQVGNRQHRGLSHSAVQPQTPGQSRYRLGDHDDIFIYDAFYPLSPPAAQVLV